MIPSQLKQFWSTIPAVKKCPSFKNCLGGAKCVTYAYFKNSFAPDPQCWRLFKKLPDSDKYRAS